MDTRIILYPGVGNVKVWLLITKWGLVIMQLMGFLRWHYTKAFRYFLGILRNYFAFIFNYFSIPLLFKTLFWRFRRMDLTEKRPGLHIDIWFGNLVENVVSRLIGFFARAFIIILGLFAVAVFSVLAAFAIFAFLLFPLPTIYFYLKSKNGDKVKVADIKKFFASSYGRFFLDKLGVDYEKLAGPREAPLKECFVGERTELFLQLCKTWPPLERYVKENNISEEDLNEIVSWYKRTHSIKLQVARFWDMDNLLKVGNIGSILSFGYTNFLDQYCLDITSAYQKRSYYHLYGRHGQLRQLEESLLQSGGNSFTIVTGARGVGKRSLIYNLAEKIDLRHAPMKLRNKRVLMLNTETFLSAYSETAVPAKFIEMMGEGGRAGNVIVVVDVLEKLLSNKYGVDLLSVFNKAKSYNFPPIIGIMEIPYFNELCAGNDALNVLFTVVKVKEINSEDSLRILEDFANKAFHKDKIIISYKALKAMVSLADKFLLNEPRPERALAVFNKVLASAGSRNFKAVSGDFVKETVSRMVGVPVINEEKEGEKLLNLEKLLHKRVIGQDPAINILSKSLRRVRTGIASSKRPSGAFLFLGPTGVGKTETAKALADIYFGSEKYLIRFDMAEYTGEGALERMLGSFKSGKPGMLTSALKNNPFGILLLDEIEKAGREALNLLLTMLDEGYITDAFGNRMSAENLTIIATSNAGAEYIRTYINENRPQDKLGEELTDFVLKEKIFSPEFINRFDAVVVYKPLSTDEIKLVVELMLGKLSKRIEEERGIVVKYKPQLVEDIIKNGYDPAFGGRSVRRYIQDNVEDAVAKKILENGLKAGDSILI